ncbi:hypothetical protein FHS14_003374 [Paenibacillus baekrokdamisoli]|uniref:hypothetical protein n=1 Tax=Paenibacillus baekrokdamisoli TaxID=1712516 RepID=UPI0013E0E81E|nr:hypothetical protein [Paenibacillus baekrokdamisoli]MBB3070379.1 hypothetical protein [Paenibacillus baekrokdamisoli]
MRTVELGVSIAIQAGNVHEENPNVDLNIRLFDSLSDADQTIDLLNNIEGRKIGSGLSTDASRKDIAP